MSLFFETETQSVTFLAFCAVGFAIALLFDVEQCLLTEYLKPMGDVLLFLLCAVLFLIALFALKADSIRLYHWLALALGAILYLCGLRRAVRKGMSWIKRKRDQRKKTQTNPSEAEGTVHETSNG